METDEDLYISDHEEINIYGDLGDFDLGEEIEKLKNENKRLEERITSLNGDKNSLVNTIADLKEVQDNLTKNISSLFVTAKAEIERKNRMIDELRAQVDNRTINRYNPDVRKRKDRENTSPEVSTAKKPKSDDNTAKDNAIKIENQEPKPLPKPDEKEESRSRHPDRQKHTEGDDTNRCRHRSKSRPKYTSDNHGDQPENDRYNPRYRHTNSRFTENDKYESRNKYYSNRYNSYEDDGYHSRSAHSYDRYKNGFDDRYGSRYFNDRYNNRTNNYFNRDEMHDDRDYRGYNQNLRSDFVDLADRGDRDDYRGDGEGYNYYRDNRYESNNFRNEREQFLERPSRSRPTTPFTSDNHPQEIQQEPVHDTSYAETGRRSITPMPLPEDIEVPKPKPPKKRLKMLEEMEEKVKLSRQSQSSTSFSETSEGADAIKSAKHDRDVHSTTNKSTKSDQMERLFGCQRKESCLIKEKIIKKNETVSSTKKGFEAKNIEVCTKKNIKQTLARTVPEKNMKKPEKQLIRGKSLDVNDKKLASTEPASKDTIQKTANSSKTVTKQNSTAQKVASESNLVPKDKCQKQTQNEIKPSTRDIVGRSAHEPDQIEDKKAKKSGPNMKNISDSTSSSKQDRKFENKTKNTKNLENISSEMKQNTEKSSKNVNINPKVVTNEETSKKCKSMPFISEKPFNSDKETEESKGNTRKQSGKKDLERDKVDGQRKIEEKNDIKVVKQKDMESKEDSIKYSQKSSKRSSKDKVVTIDNDEAIKTDQKDKNNITQTTKTDRKKEEKQKDIVEVDKIEKHEIIEDSSEVDVPKRKRKRKESETEIKGKNIENQAKLDTEELTKGKDEKGKALNKKDGQKDDKIAESRKDIVTDVDKIQKHKGIIEDSSEMDVLKRKKRKKESETDVKEKDIENQAKLDTQELTKEKKENEKALNKEDSEKNDKIVECVKWVAQITENEIKIKEEINKEQKNDTKEEANTIRKVELENNVNPVEKGATRMRRKSTIVDEYKNVKNKFKESEYTARKDEPFKVDETLVAKEIHSKKGKNAEHSTTKRSSKSRDIAKQDSNADMLKVCSKEVIVMLEMDKQKNVDTYKAKTKDEAEQQRSRYMEYSKKRKSLCPEVIDLKNMGEKSEESLNKVDSGYDTNLETKSTDPPVNIKILEKGQGNSPREICTIVTRSKNKPSATNIQEVQKTKTIKSLKKSTISAKKEHLKFGKSEDIISSSSDSESDTQPDEILNSVKSIKTVDKLIEIKDIEQENARPREIATSLSESSTSDDTIIASKPDNTKSIEKKLDSLMSKYIENFVAEHLSDDKPENVENTVDKCVENVNRKEEVEQQDEKLLKENIPVKTTVPKINVLEVINIVNIRQKPAIQIRSLDVEKPIATSSKLPTNDEKSSESCKSGTQISPNQGRTTRRRITPTPVKEKQPLCTFENILTQSETFATASETIHSPLHLTHEGEIPVLHLEEHQINNLPTEVNINDKNIINLLDSMNISNIDCDIPKFKSFNAESAVISDSNVGEAGLTFENKIGKVTCAPSNRQGTENVGDSQNCTSSSDAGAGNVNSDKISGSVIQPGTALVTPLRRRRRCRMVIRD